MTTGNLANRDGQPNWEGIQLYSERGKKILELVKADWQQVKKGR